MTPYRLPLQVICTIRRASRSVYLNVDYWIVTPVNKIIDMLAVGLWGPSKAPACTYYLLLTTYPYY